MQNENFCFPLVYFEDQYTITHDWVIKDKQGNVQKCFNGKDNYWSVMLNGVEYEIRLLMKL